ncbi:MAG: hypothetical protein AAGE52_16560 [Myxococcota bacterium]
MKEGSKRAIQRYLREAPSALSALPAYDHIVVIPSYGEGDLTPTYRSLADADGGSRLVIVVLNEPPNASEEKRRSNDETRAWAMSLGPVATLFATASWIRREPADLLVVERTARTTPIPAKHGVGGARTLGGDLALALAVQDKLGDDLIRMTDGDAAVPNDYFTRPLPADTVPRNIAGCVFPYAHHPAGAEHPAITCYEIALRYYVQGLRAAGSPYAIHTVGSSMAVTPLAYAQVRGVPKRNAAEDFYLLNKVAKVGAIPSLAGAPIVLSGRASDRVPFGTGRAVADFRAQAQCAEDYPLYDPRCFDALEEVLASLREDRAASFDRFGTDATTLSEIVRALGVPEERERARQQTKSPAAYQRHTNTFFDAFVTRKFVHAVRDRCFPSRPLPEVLRDAAFLDAPEELGAALDHLRELDGVETLR